MTLDYSALLKGNVGGETKLPRANKDSLDFNQGEKKGIL